MDVDMKEHGRGFGGKEEKDLYMRLKQLESELEILNI